MGGDLVRVVSETLQLDAAGACLFSHLLEVERDGYSDGLCRTCAPYVPAHRTISHLQKECGHPFREPQQLIVIAVMRERHKRYFSRYQWGFLRDDQFLACSGTAVSLSRLPSPKKRLT